MTILKESIIDDKNSISRIAANTVWNDTRFDFDGGNDLIYLGRHLVLGAATTDVDWYITKFTWSSGKPTRKQMLKGIWDNRDSIF